MNVINMFFTPSSVWLSVQVHVLLMLCCWGRLGDSWLQLPLLGLCGWGHHFSIHQRLCDGHHFDLFLFLNSILEPKKYLLLTENNDSWINKCCRVKWTKLELTWSLHHPEVFCKWQSQPPTSSLCWEELHSPVSAAGCCCAAASIQPLVARWWSWDSQFPCCSASLCPAVCLPGKLSATRTKTKFKPNYTT